MSRFLVRRLMGAIPLLFGVAVISFILMQAAPGGPDATYARSPRMTPERLEAIRARLGIDQPIWVQFYKWVLNLLRGDLGLSYVQSRPVTELIWHAFPNTVLLVSVGLVIALVFALIFGVLAALKPYGWFDNTTAIVTYFGLAMPVFWFALMLQIIFAVKLGWLPSSGLHDPQDPGGLDTLEHLILPGITLAIGSIAVWSRYIRSSTIESLQQDYVRTARAKGLNDGRVLSRHVLRNSLTPFVTVAAIDIPLYLTGVVFIETVYSLPGMGRLFYDSLTRRDYPVLMGVLLFSAMLIIIGNLIADVLYAWLDPRISFE